MKIRIEPASRAGRDPSDPIDPNKTNKTGKTGDPNETIEEIVIRGTGDPDLLGRLAEEIRAAVETVLAGEDEITLSASGSDCFVPKREILFFESAGGKVYAHTADRIYTAPYRLIRLEAELPSAFVRISKSAIANLDRVASLRRELVGNGVITFRGCEKTVWFSRTYYKSLAEKLAELRARRSP